MRGLTFLPLGDHIPSPWMKSISIQRRSFSKNSYEGITGCMDVEFKNSLTDSNRLYFDMFANQNARIETNLLSTTK